MLGKRYAFRYKVGALLFTVVILISSFLGVCQFLLMKENLESNFEQSKSLVRDRVLNIVSDADHMNLIIERQLEKDSKSILEIVNSRYESEGHINFDLTPYLRYEGMDLFIIDQKNTVVAATKEEDMGLDFSPWTDFSAILDGVRVGGSFSTLRVSLSIVDSQMTKYCYLPSADGRYIFETGTLMVSHTDLFKGSGFDNFDQKIIKDYYFVDGVVLYDYEGVSYKKVEDGQNIRISPEHTECFEESIKTMQMVEMISVHQGQKAIYQYVPYQIIGAIGANERNVIEIIFNDNVLMNSLNNNLWINLRVVLIGAVLAAAYGFYSARRITKPLEKMTDGIKQVSEGNYDVNLDIRSNDEFALMGNQFNHMSNVIKRLMEERFKTEKDLEIKNEEILMQKDELSALYQETAAINEELESLLKENNNCYFETVRALANAVEEKDSYTGGHCERVMTYSLEIAKEMKLSDQEMNELRFGSVLHDIGKIGIPETVLNKEGALSKEEFDLIKKHPEIGNRILKNLNFMGKSRLIVNHHHERVDGRGYPDGLKGDQIDILAKIVCAADAYDAMTSMRPYRMNAMSKEMAISELIKNRGTQFDEVVVDAFVHVLETNLSA